MYSHMQPSIRSAGLRGILTLSLCHWMTSLGEAGRGKCQFPIFLNLQYRDERTAIRVCPFRRERRSLQEIPNYLLLWAKPNVHTKKLIELCSAINTGMLKPQKAERSIYLHNSLSSHSSACEKCFHLSALPDSN